MVVDDNFLDDEEAHALILAFRNTGADNINWCKTSDAITPPSSDYINVLNCNYADYDEKYLRADMEFTLWDRILFTDNFEGFVLHTAHDHVLYVGSDEFVETATPWDNDFRDGWLSVRGTAISDLALKQEYSI